MEGGRLFGEDTQGFV